MSPEKSYRNYRKRLAESTVKSALAGDDDTPFDRAVTPYIAVHIGDVIRVCDEENYGETGSVLSLASANGGYNLLRLAKIGAVLRDILRLQLGTCFYRMATKDKDQTYSNSTALPLLQKDLKVDFSVTNPLMFVLKLFRSFSPTKTDMEMSRIRKLAKDVIDDPSYELSVSF